MNEPYEVAPRVDELKLVAKSLQWVMAARFEEFIALGVMTDTGGNKWHPTSRHIYIDRGSSVLGVAHLDSVRPFTGFWCNHEYICCPTIDNRLGAWLMLYGLPSMGIEIDVLLTENEERCASTAADFVPSKEYNWCFSFDRMADDVVLYHYEDCDLIDRLEQHGFDVGFGSYSDVADLELGVKGINFGCGMRDYHSDFAYARVDELLAQVRRFTSFYAATKDTRLPHVERRYTGKGFDWNDDAYWYGRSTGRASDYWSADEWDAFVKRINKLEDDEVIEATKSSLSYPPVVLRPQGKSLKYEDELEARVALSDPFYYFDEQPSGEDWHWENSLGAAESVEDQEMLDLYIDGVLVICDYCDNLFERSKARHYPSLNARLCKRCFAEFASDQCV